MFCLHYSRVQQDCPGQKKMLLILPEGEKYDYTCVCCGASIGDKMVTEKGKPVFSR